MIDPISPEGQKQQVALFQKIFAVLAAIETVEKKGKAEYGGGYDYLRAVDMFSVAREEFLKKGLLFTTSVVGSTRWVNEGGKQRNGVTVETVHEFIDIETGAMHSVRSVGDGVDSGDKGIYKALTGAVKYALRNNFLVSDPTADPEADPNGSRPAEAQDRPRSVQERKVKENLSPAPKEAPEDEQGLPQAFRTKLFAVAAAAHPDLDRPAVVALVKEATKKAGVASGETKDIPSPDMDQTGVYDSILAAVGGEQLAVAKTKKGKKS